MIYSYRHKRFVKSFVKKSFSKTIAEIFINMVSRVLDKDYLGTIVDGKVEYISYMDAYQKTRRISAFLNDLGEKLYEKECGCIVSKRIVGIFSSNRVEWAIAELATYFSALTNCPIYNTLGVEAMKHILIQTGMDTVFVSGENCKKIKSLLEMTQDHKLENLIVFDEINEDLKNELEEKGLKIFFFNDILEKYDAIYDFCFKNPKYLEPDLAATICYTSGTTGKPKGCILTHRNFVAAIFGFHNTEMVFKKSREEVYISYLPLAHVMERLCFLIVMSFGEKAAFFRGNVKTIVDDIKIIKPTFLVGVPRVFNGIYQKIRAEVSKRSLLTQGIFYLSLKTKIFLQNFNIYKNPILDKLVFAPIQREFGGKLRAGLTGSAPINKDVKKYIQAVLGIRLYEGYGQTEGLAANILDYPANTKCGSVGIPFPANRVGFEPYENFDGISGGEILLKGENISPGYYKNPEATKNAYTPDGWLKTGDIGVRKKGLFYIVGRKSETFKTSLGEFIAPEKIENILKKAAIDDIMITGNSEEDYIVALVVCLNKNLSENEIYQKILDAGNIAVQQGSLMKFEIPRKILVLRETFQDISHEFVTITLKKVRKKIIKYFSKEIAALYRKK
ncbi:Long-chain-fatty-acid--CoA ligase 5 [Dictyocoela muelleri]|nr:Long-chain-fatty-acid--CoA ligase 5 [Dictyocoela muelleri]